MENLNITQELLRKKLQNVLCSLQFCALCYETEKSFNSLHEKLKIVSDNWTQDVLLQDIYSYVFNEIDELPASEHICSECTEQLKQSYIFIKKSKFVTKLLYAYIDDLELKSNDLITHFEDDIKFDKKQIVIVLDKNDISPRKTLKKSYKCIECKKVLPSFLLWKQHKKKFHKQEFKCTICSVSYKTQRSLSAHYKIHSKARCKVCHKILPDGELKNHVRKLHKDNIFICNICDDVFYTLRDFRAHEKLVHSINRDSLCEICLTETDGDDTHICKLNCYECQEVPCIHNRYLISYREQLLKRVSKVKCPDCNYLCRTKELFIGHVNKAHLDHHPYTCDKCGQQFYSRFVFRAHIRSFHVEMNVCEYCDGTFNSPETLESHEAVCKLTIRELICESCPASFDSIEELENHEKGKHKRVFPCDSCNKKFLTESKRKEHVNNVHSGVQKQIDHKRTNLKCLICEKTVDTRGELIRHTKSHGPNVKYICKICNTELGSLRKLRGHLRNHAGPYATCDVCGKTLREASLEKHLENHKFDVILNCSSSEKSFQNTFLQYNRKRRAAEVQCPLCDKMINPAKLRRHAKEHKIASDPSLLEMREQRRNKKCEICGYVTWNNMLLECHMNGHHLKIQPYVCHYCSRSFAGKNLLEKHIVLHKKKIQKH